MTEDMDLFFHVNLSRIIVKKLNDIIDRKDAEIESLKETIKDLKADLENKDNIISDLQSNLDLYIETMED